MSSGLKRFWQVKQVILVGLLKAQDVSLLEGMLCNGTEQGNTNTDVKVIARMAPIDDTKPGSRGYASAHLTIHMVFGLFKKFWTEHHDLDGTAGLKNDCMLGPDTSHDNFFSPRLSSIIKTVRNPSGSPGSGLKRTGEDADFLTPASKRQGPDGRNLMEEMTRAARSRVYEAVKTQHQGFVTDQNPNKYSVEQFCHPPISGKEFRDKAKTASIMKEGLLTWNAFLKPSSHQGCGSGLFATTQKEKTTRVPAEAIHVVSAERKLQGSFCEVSAASFGYPLQLARLSMITTS